jgi:hypothetical protein
VREEEWEQREKHNNTEAASWVAEAPDGWGGSGPISPVIEEGWPGTRPKDQCFPHLSDDMPLCPNGWPDLLVSRAAGIQVTIELKSTVEDTEGHSTCRSLMPIGYLSASDLLSFLCHSSIGTSFRSCAPVLVAMDSLTGSSSDSGALELEVSEALWMNLSKSVTYTSGILTRSGGIVS